MLKIRTRKQPCEEVSTGRQFSSIKDAISELKLKGSYTTILRQLQGNTRYGNRTGLILTKK